MHAYMQMAPVIKPRKRGALTAVLLVGGATRMPAVERFIKNMTGGQRHVPPLALGHWHKATVG